MRLGGLCIAIGSGGVSGPRRGPEKVINGDFSSGTDWVLDSGATIGGGKLNFSSVASTFGAHQTSVTYTNGVTYEIIIVVDANTLGQPRIRLNNSSLYVVPAAAGTYTFQRVAGASGGLDILGTGTTSCVIDSISIKQVL